ncbi:protein Pop3 [Artemisia annua]|uniref:Protein Pop3 n=1 Tax=Artemisia annua TaxID=35608 RepID=A0A2U1MTX8_ARTAN|nr:protein Pop3 [Artemisia annua]
MTSLNMGYPTNMHQQALGLSLLVPSESVSWGRDVSTANMHQGFTHVFESIFETMKDVETYSAYPAHLEFVNHAMTLTDASIILDYKPTIVHM